MLRARASITGVVATAVVVVSLALADSINPVTILVAAYLASRDEPRPRVAGFVIGVFSVYLLGGLVLMLGPGELLRSASGSHDSPGFHVASLVLGAAAIAAAVALWTRRSRWGRPELPDRALEPGSAFVLGAAVTGIDLPTAFPYFAAIGAIVSSDASLAWQIVLLVAFNALYVLPLAVILTAHLLLADRFEPMLARLRGALDRAAVPLVVAITLTAGLALAVSGARGLTG
jgi:cytochrome c biogenesis protein CcdA